jgi:APA family basic amino acid/polyamine antiporter
VPIAGIVINLSMMFALGWHNWLRIFVWLAIGLVIYAVYGRKRSALALSRELSLGGASPGGRALDD